MIQELKVELNGFKVGDRVKLVESSNDDVLQRMFLRYIDNIFAYVNHEKIIDDFTHEMVEPDERLMRSIEEKIDVSEPNVDDFRRMIAAFLGSITRNEGKENLKWDRNPQLAKALVAKLQEDTHDSPIKPKKSDAPKFKVGDRVRDITTQSKGTVTAYPTRYDRNPDYIEVFFDESSTSCIIYIGGIEKIDTEEKSSQKFKVGDKVIINCPGSALHKKEATITGFDKPHPNLAEIKFTDGSKLQSWPTNYLVPKFEVGDKLVRLEKPNKGIISTIDGIAPDGKLIISWKDNGRNHTYRFDLSIIERDIERKELEHQKKDGYIVVTYDKSGSMDVPPPIKTTPIKCDHQVKIDDNPYVFQIGDRVRLKENIFDYTGVDTMGYEGNVVATKSLHPGYIGVRFDKEHREFTTLYGNCDDKHGGWCIPLQLEKIEPKKVEPPIKNYPKFFTGERVKVINWTDISSLKEHQYNNKEAFVVGTGSAPPSGADYCLLKFDHKTESVRWYWPEHLQKISWLEPTKKQNDVGYETIKFMAKFLTTKFLAKHLAKFGGYAILTMVIEFIGYFLIEMFIGGK